MGIFTTIGSWFAGMTTFKVDLDRTHFEKLENDVARIEETLLQIAKKQQEVQEQMALNFSALTDQVARLPGALVVADAKVASKLAEFDAYKTAAEARIAELVLASDETAVQAQVDAITDDLKSKVDAFFPVVAAPVVEEPVVDAPAPEAPVVEETAPEAPVEG